jgi:hypothetical protein
MPPVGYANIRLDSAPWLQVLALDRAGQGPPFTGGQTLRTGIQNPLRIPPDTSLAGRYGTLAE